MTSSQAIADTIAQRYGALPPVVAVVLAGSQGFQTADSHSDLDFYIYVEADLPIEMRRAIATHHAERAEVDNQFWEPGDE